MFYTLNPLQLAILSFQKTYNLSSFTKERDVLKDEENKLLFYINYFIYCSIIPIKSSRTQTNTFS